MSEKISLDSSGLLEFIFVVQVLTQRYLVEEGSLRKFGRLSMPISGNSG